MTTPIRFRSAFCSFLLILIIAGLFSCAKNFEITIEDYKGFPKHFDPYIPDSLDADPDPHNPVIEFGPEDPYPGEPVEIGDPPILCQNVILDQVTCAENNGNFRRRFTGTLYYVIFPGSQWAGNAQAVQRKLNEAISFYQKYCIDLTFTQLTLGAADAARFQGQENNLFNQLIANVGGQDKLGTTTVTDARIIRGYASLMNNLENGLYNAARRADRTLRRNNFALIIFADTYFGGENRTLTLGSSTRESSFQVGIMFADANSQNILSHELRHLFGKSSRTTQGPTGTWDENNCLKHVARVTRTNPYNPFNFANLIDVVTYRIITSSRRGNRLLR